MKIIDQNLKPNGSLQSIGKIIEIVLHHAVTPDTYTALDMDRIHKNNGWTMCGYHFVIDGKGNIYRGRPEDKLGAHCANANTGRIGICFAGDFDKNQMKQAQINAGIELVRELKKKYNVPVTPHKKVVKQSTACPGKNFPFDKIVNGSSSNNQIKPPTTSKKLWETSISGQEVIELQKELSKQKLYKGEIDGFFGDLTLRACPILKHGSKGNITKLMQKRLGNRGYDIGKYGADGAFGDSTLKAVKRMQDCFNLIQDGIVGENSWKALYGLNQGRF